MPAGCLLGHFIRVKSFGRLHSANTDKTAQLCVLVKRILRKYGYPPDKQEKATRTMLEEAALLSEEWAVA